MAAFDIDDFSHFVSYQLLGDLFGEDLIRAVTEFQYEVRARGRRDNTLELATKQRPSGRRLPLTNSSSELLDRTVWACAVVP